MQRRRSARTRPAVRARHSASASPREPGAPRLARRALEQIRDQLAPETFADLVAVVSELVTHSVRFGPGDPIEMRIAVGSTGSVRGRVNDGGDPRPRLRTARHDNAGGIGLLVVSRLATHVRVEPNGVWFELAAES